jgi:hypothetical protein
MMPRQLLRVLCLVLVVPLIAAACAGHSYGRSHMTAFRPMGARPMRGFAMRDPIARLLDHQGSLRLTPPQVNSLIAIDEKLQTDNRPLRERLASLRSARHGHGHEQMKGGTGGGGGTGADTVNLAARMARRDSVAAVMQVLRENKWRATNAAYAQLTDEQMRAAARLEGGGRAGGGPAGRDGAPDRRGPRGMNGPPGVPSSGPGES